ncbi:hypothetical protein [Streptomyces sp. NPDC046939]|uniref:hypothetical protein n=1 Tax=Streptomyces sp. NPDC046939 TaxID=3155376 RepID=UPI0033CBAA20
MAFVVLLGTVAVLGIHALVLGRVPGSWLQRGVRALRLWGAGGPAVPASWYLRSPSVLVVGPGLPALGYTVKPTR